ncbi:hypothetical protein GURASL_18170 [Geotalea uraniireducens]|uniref:Uncharacterized protein n=1 Tax=Geotalea uraniireducens TaxID=351604 RepID=A0ABN6VRB5_9BACT|nr:hypothetical protein [Geotalea uraniireducens]BDV42894.1 hypothetical protein GURASL_18170 [Geotalea uraniireducens]
MPRNCELVYDKGTSIISDPATAREYIRDIAMCFTDLRDFSEFLGLCDIAQAALAYCVIAEANYFRSKQTHYKNAGARGNADLTNEVKLYRQYQNALAEMEIVKKNLNSLLARLGL